MDANGAEIDAEPGAVVGLQMRRQCTSTATERLHGGPHLGLERRDRVVRFAALRVPRALLDQGRAARDGRPRRARWSQGVRENLRGLARHGRILRAPAGVRSRDGLEQGHPARRRVARSAAVCDRIEVRPTSLGTLGIVAVVPAVLHGARPAIVTGARYRFMASRSPGLASAALSGLLPITCVLRAAASLGELLRGRR
jgi:hypothetical protein